MPACELRAELLLWSCCKHQDPTLGVRSSVGGTPDASVRAELLLWVLMFEAKPQGGAILEVQELMLCSGPPGPAAFPDAPLPRHTPSWEHVL
jgi:hypothetical protein